MAYDVVDPESFLENGLFAEEAFLRKVDEYQWQQHLGKHVLVRGCRSAIMPPWVFMVLTGRLAETAKSVRYGNEHDNVVVYRQQKH